MDPGAARAKLEGELGGKLPAIAERLEAEQLADLAEAIDAAKRAQAKEASDAADTALRHVPRVLRGAAKKVLLG